MAYKTLEHTDMSLFKNRLWKLMEKKEIYTAKDLAKKLYDGGYVSVCQKESDDEPSTIYGRAVGSVEKKIQRHLNSNGAEKLQGEFVIAYCKFFECSADYLLGKIECKNHDLQFIHDYTGLSETAIKRFHEFTTYHQGQIRLAIMDHFICDISFSLRLTDDINSYFENYYLYETKKKIFWQEDDATRQLDLYDYLTRPQSVSRRKLKEYENLKDAKHFAIQKKFDDILECYMKQLYDKYSEKAPDTN